MSCFVCGRLVTRLHRHHVNWDHSDESDWNVVALCGVCHRVVHQVGWNCLADLLYARSVVQGKENFSPSQTKGENLGEIFKLGVAADVPFGQPARPRASGVTGGVCDSPDHTHGLPGTPDAV